MDLIYMNADKEDVGVLQEYELDLAYGEDENNFECTTVASRHCCEAGYFLYMEGTEYGGVIDAIRSDTSSEEVVYSGRTWHGIIGSKIIVPLLDGEASTDRVTIRTKDSKGNSLVKRYLIISGDANSCIQFIIDRLGLADMFEAPDRLSDVHINSYQFGRYVDGYMGIRKMLASAGLKMKLEYTNGKVIVSAVPRYDFSKDDSFNSDLVELKISKRHKTVNHLICLGKGELEDRLVIHLYADSKGNISQTQTQFGLDEYSAVYDYSAIESEEELMEKGIDELKALWSQDQLSMDFDESMDAYDVGDVVGGVDNVTGISAVSTITKKIVTIQNGKVSIDLSTDTVSQSGSGSTGNASGSGGESGSIGTAEDAEKLGGKAPEYYIQPVNLLDNSNFRNPVNQRGDTSYSGAFVYGIDRWETTNANTTLTLGDNGITLTNTTANSAGYLLQIMENPKRMLGKTVTLAVCTNGGNIRVASGQLPTAFPSANTVYCGVNDGSYRVAEILLTTNSVWIRIYSNASESSRSFQWTALYEGSYTAETLPPYVPKGYTTELLECQRYFIAFPTYSNYAIPFAHGTATSETTARVELTLPVTMRIVNPSITADNVSWYLRSAVKSTVATVAVLRSIGNKLILTATVAEGLTNYQQATLAYYGQSGKTLYICFSADL